jgi:hypothetical protein
MVQERPVEVENLSSNAQVIRSEQQLKKAESGIRAGGTGG